MSCHFAVRVEKPGLVSCPLVGDLRWSQEVSESTTGSIHMPLALKGQYAVPSRVEQWLWSRRWGSFVHSANKYWATHVMPGLACTRFTEIQDSSSQTWDHSMSFCRDYLILSKSVTDGMTRVSATKWTPGHSLCLVLKRSQGAHRQSVECPWSLLVWDRILVLAFIDSLALAKVL